MSLFNSFPGATKLPAPNITRSPTITSEIAFKSPDSRDTVSEAAKHAFLPLLTIKIANVRPGVGLEVSVVVTVNVGVPVGVDVGDPVGVDVGIAVGAIDMVGVDVGDAVGVAVGVDVGDTVGAIDIVGADVGDAVGE